MKRVVTWIGVNLDILVALSLAIVVSALDIADIVSDEAVSNATVATLAVLAFVMLRSRMRSETAEDTVGNAVRSANQKLDLLPGVLQGDAKARLVKGEEFNRILAEAHENTDRWIFKGSTGAYVRAITLPTCVQNARRHRRALIVRLEMLDPSDISLCRRFVRLHQSLATTPDSPEWSWTVEGTRKELYATVLAACWYQQRYELLDIEIGFSATVSMFRYELSSLFLIITQRGPNFPATVVRGDTLALDCWGTELHASLQQARPLHMKKAKDALLSASPTVEEVRNLFSQLDLPTAAEYPDETLVEITTMALGGVDPYSKWG